VILELLSSAPAETGAFLNFDWGSQSIAQSKFQRAFPEGKGDNQVSFPPAGQQIFSKKIPAALAPGPRPKKKRNNLLKSYL
jgi:hypothetical protein